MMELLEWFQLLNAHALSQAAIQRENSVLYAYAVLAIIVRKPSLFLAFFSCTALVNFYQFQFLTDYQVYILSAIIYSYVYHCCDKKGSKFCCLAILALSVTYAIDSIFYGEHGIYGTHETYIYNNIEYFSLLAHTVFICSFISITRIKNHLLGLVGVITYFKNNTYNFGFCCYNAKKGLVEKVIRYGRRKSNNSTYCDH